MAVTNTIKLAQLATGELAAFINSGLGITSSTNVIHSYTEEFTANVGIGGNLNVTGSLAVKGNATFASGLLAQSGIQVQGQISGQSIQIDNFSLSSGRFGTITIGAMNLTGVPIYSSGVVASGLALPSGTVFGVTQKINDPRWEYDASGNLQPATGNLGVTVVLLCVSTGT